MTKVSLKPHEQLALAGLVRFLIQADGRYSPEEFSALTPIVEDLLTTKPGPDSPYREGEGEPDAAAGWALLDRAAEELDDEAAVQAAAKAVTDQTAREAIYLALFDLAAADTITSDEWPVLEWLQKEWGITSPAEG